MKNLVWLLLIPLFCCTNPKQEQPIDTPAPETIDVPDKDTLKVNLSCSFDFLGIKVSGDIDHFFENLLASKYFSLVSLSIQKWKNTIGCTTIWMIFFAVFLSFSLSVQKL